MVHIHNTLELGETLRAARKRLSFQYSPDWLVQPGAVR
jgi:hypothetical protein